MRAVKRAGEERYQTAVVRVEVRDRSAGGLLIELLEVGRERREDRLLGWATNAAEACRVLEVWLRGLSQPGDDAPPGDFESSGETDP